MNGGGEVGVVVRWWLLCLQESVSGEEVERGGNMPLWRIL